MTSIKLALAGAALALAVAGTGAQASENAREKANIATVKAFYDAAINQKDFDKAKAYLGPRYTQHNPTAQDGPEGLKGYIAFLKDKFPQQHNDFKQFLADGDYVVVHVHSVQTPGSRGRAIIDIFKLDKGKVVEHWDVIQEVPEKAANTNGMF